MGWTGVWQRCCAGLPLPRLLGLLLPLLLALLCSVRSLELKEGDAVCTASNSCFVLYFQRKTFLYAWRSCKEQGGDLATLKDPQDAGAVERLFAEVNLRGKHGKLRTWIGLQRQPRQCSASRPLRGFSWVTGDQETRFTNWLGEDSAAACATPRCVVMEYSGVPDADNLKWVDGALLDHRGRVPVQLTHLPYGSMATVPCPAETVGDQTVLCTDMADGTVNWSRGAPFCSAKQSWCAEDNGGCHQMCIDKEDMHVCMCIEGYVLGDDGMSCLPDDPCLSSPCEFECVPVTEGFRCDCPEGYVLEPDEQSCRDLDECLQMPCEQQCVNSPGSYECRCLAGYQLDEATGDCEDVDECMDSELCEHACENMPGSFVCHCHLGFAPTPEDPTRCQDIDECQIEDTCDQMCINYVGGFECYCYEGYELQSNHYTCSVIAEPTEYPSWSQPWQTNREYSTDPPDYGWMTHAPVKTALVPSPVPDYYDVVSNTDNLGQYGSFESLEPVETESPPSVEMLNPTPDPNQESPIPETPTPTPTPSPTTNDITTPDWYEEEEEETTATTAVPTTTFIEGAWNWFLHAATDKPLPLEPAVAGVELGTSNCVLPTTTKHPVLEFFSPSFGSPSVSPVSERDVEGSPSEGGEPEEGGQQEEKKSAAGPGPGPEEGAHVNEEEEEGGSGLLVGLLVPLFIILLALVVLGAIYCARSSSSKPQNKNTSDCYHWISGAADKAGAEHSGTPTKSHV
ncbi:hypothetical protein ACEWY4_025053 [Coilia grayii]|uniref:CD248 n=1 Tax=Coilia grayii TaxID=363190 RepID=A0ABD1IWN9_9TELE